MSNEPGDDIAELSAEEFTPTTVLPADLFDELMADTEEVQPNGALATAFTKLETVLR
ncbi:MAG: hypothetical protein ACOYBP_08675 [Microbacteriaceae bacterium]